jgi:hypothetical protein
MFGKVMEWLDKDGLVVVPRVRVYTVTFVKAKIS